MKSSIIPFYDKYAFVITDDMGKQIFSSLEDHFLLSFIKPKYKYAWQACKDSVKLGRQYSHHLDALQINRISQEVKSINVSA